MKGLHELGVVFHMKLYMRMTILALTTIISFYLDRYLSDDYPQLIFYTHSLPSSSPSVTISPNANVILNVSTLLSSAARALSLQDKSLEVLPSHRPPPPLPLSQSTRVGIMDKDGTMREDFNMGLFDLDPIDSDGEEWNEMGIGNGEVDGRARIKINKFHLC